MNTVILISALVCLCVVSEDLGEYFAAPREFGCAFVRENWRKFTMQNEKQRRGRCFLGRILVKVNSLSSPGIHQKIRTVSGALFIKEKFVLLVDIL